jgi:hypothetical protein
MESFGKTSSGCCEACGRPIETPIQVTNQSATPLRIYTACPFCLSEVADREEADAKHNIDVVAVPVPESFEPITPPDIGSVEDEQTAYPHQFGYLKKRPKNTPIPDTCLTCQKMIQCLI